ncbi:MAG: hypothetical protein IT210_10465, partial [Armatimonadetes bacterium]|nr:hypothetical protein [Armatimonadota bacterium]
QYLSPARNFQVKLPYTLSDTGGSAAYDCKVEALNNDFSQIYSNAGLPTDLGSQTVCFPLLMATGGYYRLIIGATDSHNTADKVHLRKLALQNAPTIYMPIAENYNNTFATTPASSNASAYQDPLPDPRSYYSRVYHDLPNINAVMAAKKRIADDSIIFIDNHGSPGWIQLAGGNDYYAVGWSGSKQDGTTARIDDADWSKVRFVCFVGCETALSDPLYGNLLDASVDAGAQLAMGFTGIITRHRDSDPPLGSYPDIWSNAFWQYACGWSSAAPYPQYSPTPYGAANYAADAILSQFGKTGGFDTYQFRGYYGCLVPAFQFNP